MRRKANCDPEYPANRTDGGDDTPEGDRPHRSAYDYVLVIGPGRSGTRFLLANLKTNPDLDTARSEGAYYYRSRRRLRKAAARSSDEAGRRRPLVDVANLAYKDPALALALQRLRDDGCRTLVVAMLREHCRRAVSMMHFRRSRGQLSALFGARRLERAVLRDRLRPEHLHRLVRLDVDLVVVPFSALVDRTEAVLRVLSMQCGVADFDRVHREAINQSVDARLVPLAALSTALVAALHRVGLRGASRRLKHASLAKKVLFRPARVGRYRLGRATESLLSSTYEDCISLLRESSSWIENAVYVRCARISS